MSEIGIQSAICDYVVLRKHFFFRSNNIPPTYFDKGGNRQFRSLPKYTMKGIPDIIVIHNGDFIGLEVKLGSAQCASKSGQLLDFERHILLHAHGAQHVLLFYFQGTYYYHWSDPQQPKGFTVLSILIPLVMIMTIWAVILFGTVHVVKIITDVQAACAK